MEQYANVQQILKKEEGQDNRKPIYPPTVIQAVFDANTGASLEAILAQFNSIYVQYQGTPEATRNIIPVEMRRPGLTITYTNVDGENITERANTSASKDNDYWGLDTNWSRIDELSLSGDIAVSATGTWIINGQDTGVKAVGPKGDTGLTPWLKTIANKLHFSYDNVNWEPCSDYLAIKFRNFNNRIQISYDEGKSWADISEEMAYKFKVEDNKLRMSKNLGKSWETVSDYIAAWFRIKNNRLEISRDNVNWEAFSDFISAKFRWEVTEEDLMNNTLGRLQISRNDGLSWDTLTGAVTNNLRISKYVKQNTILPTDGIAEGTIYAVGPYVEDGTSFYKIMVYSWHDDQIEWFEIGSLKGLTAGVVQEPGDSTSEVMSQKAVTEEFKKIYRIFDGGRADSKFGGTRVINCGGANAR